MLEEPFDERDLPPKAKRKSLKEHRRSLKRAPKRLSRSIRKRMYFKPPRWWLRYLLTGERLKLVSQTDHVESDRSTRVVPVSPSKRTPIGLPRFAGFTPRIDTTQRYLIEPAVSVVEYNNARALAACEFILKDGTCIHPDLYSASRDVTMSERFGQIIVSPTKRSIRSNFRRTAPMKAAISLLGQSAGNYAHFLTETLAKLPLIDRLDEYAGLPLLVDQWIDPNLRRIVDAFNVAKREIIQVDIRAPVPCERLVTLTPVAYAPPEYRLFLSQAKMPEIAPDTYQFSTHALGLLREQAWSLAPTDQEWIGEKLYLRRRTASYGNGRSIVNASNVEDFALRAGFDMIESGTLTIREQISAFRNAKEVMAPVGAALANLVFAKPGCKVTGLSAYFDGGEYDYWSTLMAALGHEIRYVVGPQVQQVGGHPLHRDYRIYMDDLAAAVGDKLWTS